MKASGSGSALIRTGSSPVQSSLIHGSTKLSFTYHDSVTGILFSGNKKLHSTRSSLHLEIKGKKDICAIRRSYSETDMMHTNSRIGGGSRVTFPTRIPEEEDEDIEVSGGGVGGRGKGRNIGDGNGGGDSSSNGGGNKNIGGYYQEMLMANPGNPLLLRNYAKFLHEVERDVVRAEEYYERAILASPGDGEVLSLYGKLIWEAHRDGSRAKTYFDQAIQASPDDCYVLGSYAQFLWDAEEDEEEGDVVVKGTTALVEAF